MKASMAKVVLANIWWRYDRNVEKGKKLRARVVYQMENRSEVQINDKVWKGLKMFVQL